MIRGMTRGAATHSQRLETWLGKEETARLSAQFKNFYWPVAVHGVPGRVYAMPGGDFAGAIEAGQECSALDRAEDVVRRHQRTTTRYRLAQLFPRQRGAFGDLTALLQAYGGGNSQTLIFRKNGGIVPGDLWQVGAIPAAGAVGAAAPGGTVPTNTTTGALSFVNPATANSSHFAGATYAGSIASNLLLYDRLFSVSKTMNSTATEAVTGVPTRYTSQTSTDEDYIGGNFVFPVTTTVLAATAHNWTVCKYTNQAGTTGQSIPSFAGVTACAAGEIDNNNFVTWFMPLASGDVGVKALTQMQLSASLASGAVDFVIGHVIAALPMAIPLLVSQLDGINTAFNLVKIFDNACLTFIHHASSSNGVYYGSIRLVSE